MEAGRAPSGRVAAERLNSEPRADLQSPSSGLYRCKFAAAKVDTVREAVERGRIGDYIQHWCLLHWSPHCIGTHCISACCIGVHCTDSPHCTGACCIGHHCISTHCISARCTGAHCIDSPTALVLAALVSPIA
ncbi:hypothetical protein I79_011375 [Cricetulus griseus]|uniref:Uncharacterized protein n=1 Tax=Cricetulus griseus TaxID=10029 RepID=G3HKZ2_CRIGR|nr:hypothetical protein I79_011375 [Cricetulus griseus]